MGTFGIPVEELLEKETDPNRRELLKYFSKPDPIGYNLALREKAVSFDDCIREVTGTVTSVEPITLGNIIGTKYSIDFGDLGDDGLQSVYVRASQKSLPIRVGHVITASIFAGKEESGRTEYRINNRWSKPGYLFQRELGPLEEALKLEIDGKTIYDRERSCRQSSRPSSSGGMTEYVLSGGTLAKTKC